MRLFMLLIIGLLAPVSSLSGNRLAKENSLYLRQNADQTVGWYAWDDAAFEKARATGRPIFVSGGAQALFLLSGPDC